MTDATPPDLETLREELPDAVCWFCGCPFDPEEEADCPALDDGRCQA